MIEFSNVRKALRRSRGHAFALALVAAVSGCAAGHPSGARVQEADQTQQHLGKRALTPLAQLEPKLSVPAAPEQSKPLSERAVTRLAKAHDLVAQQRFTEASIELERAMRYDPNHPKIHAALALLHWQARNIERAKDHAERAIKADPTLAVAHYVLGRCLLERDKTDDAIVEFRTALLCPDFGEDAEVAAMTHYYLAMALKNAGYVTAALTSFEAFEKSIAGLPLPPEGSEFRPLVADAPTRLAEVKSQLLEQLGRYSEAADALRPLVDKDRSKVDLASRQAELLLKAGRTDEALAVARRIDSDDQAVIDLLYKIHEAAGTPVGTLDDLAARIQKHPDRASLSLARARVLIRLNRKDEALQALHEHLKRFPDDDAARGTLVDLLISEDQLAAALDACAAALPPDAQSIPACGDRILDRAAKSKGTVAIGPPDASDAGRVGFAGAYLRGRLALAAGNSDTALAWLQLSLKANEHFTPTRAALAQAYIDAYRYDDALRVAARTDEAVPQSAQLERLLGIAYERLDDLPRAEVHLRAATQLDRNDVDTMYLLARVYRREGKPALAERQLRGLLEAAPDREDAREMLAFLYLSDRKPDEALAQIETLKRLSKKPTTIARCETLLDPDIRSDPKKVRQHLREAMKVGKPDAATWIAIAQSYGRTETDERRAAYEKALELDPHNQEASVALVKAMEHDLDFEGAVKLLKKMLVRRPNQHAWHLELVDALTTIQRYDEAIAHLQTRLASDSLDKDDRRDLRLRLLNALRLAGKKDEAVAKLQAWADAEPQEPQWRRWLADEYVRDDEPAKAVPIRAALLEAAPEDWSALGNLVAALAADNRHDRAAQYVLDRLSQDPESDNGVWMLASVLADGHDLDEAIELVKTRLRDTFQRQIFQDFLLAQLQLAKRYDEAIDLVESLHDEAAVRLAAVQQGQHPPGADHGGPHRRMLQPDEPQTTQGLRSRVQALRQRWALLLVDAKHYDDARRHLNEWLDNTDDPRVRVALYRMLAFCYRSEGNEPRANEVLEEALKLQPDDVLLNNDIAYAWIDQGIKLEEAEKMIRYSLGERPRQGAYLDTFGWLRYKQGKFDEAIKWLKRSQSSPVGDDPVMHDHLGDAYWRAGKHDKAIELWKEAAKLVAEREKSDAGLGSADERRVRDTVKGKIEAAESGKEPAVAPLKQPAEGHGSANDKS